MIKLTQAKHPTIGLLQTTPASLITIIILDLLTVVVSSRDIRLDHLSFDQRISSEDNQHFPTVQLPQQLSDCDKFVNSFLVTDEHKLDEKSFFISSPNNNKNQPNKNGLYNFPGFKQKSFTVSTNKYFMFSSPLFPGNYSRNLNCVKIIQAPKSNEIIQINFRKNFDLEISQNCMNDYVEIRDGKYGFSKKLVRLCGDKGERSSITSSGPYLWLNFRSDSQIERNGFQAIFHFSRNTKIPESRQYEFRESFLLETDEMIINQHDIAQQWLSRRGGSIELAERPVEIFLEIRSKAKYYFLVTLQYAKFQIQDPDCTVNFVELYSGLTLESLHQDEEQPKRPINRACNEPTLAPKVIKTGDFAVIRIVLAPYKHKLDYGSYWSDQMVNFTVIATALFEQPCNSDQIVCMKVSNETETNAVTTEDLSVVEDHHVDKPESLILQDEIDNEGFLIHGPHPVFCIAKNLFCNNHWNCPDKEDEDTICSQEMYKKNMTDENDPHIHFPGTSTMSSVSTKMNKETIDYLQHYIIIASLFAFCGICGLSSGAMTWLHRKRIESINNMNYLNNTNDNNGTDGQPEKNTNGMLVNGYQQVLSTDPSMKERRMFHDSNGEYLVMKNDRADQLRQQLHISNNSCVNCKLDDRSEGVKERKNVHSMTPIKENSLMDGITAASDKADKKICQVFWQDVNTNGGDLGISTTSDSTFQLDSSFNNENMCNCHLNESMLNTVKKDSSWIEDSTDLDNTNYEFDKFNEPLVKISNLQVLNQTSV